MKLQWTLMLAATAILAASCATKQQAGPADRLGFSGKSAGFEHSCIKWDEGKQHPSAKSRPGYRAIWASICFHKDASLINAENLKYKVVIFYDRGPHNQARTSSPIGPNDQRNCWIGSVSGRFIRYHCASDSFHTPEARGDAVRQDDRRRIPRASQAFKGTVRVVDKSDEAGTGEWNLLGGICSRTSRGLMRLAVLDRPGGRCKTYNIELSDRLVQRIRQGPRVLQCDGAPRRRVGQSGLSEFGGRCGALGNGQRPHEGRAEREQNDRCRRSRKGASLTACERAEVNRFNLRQDAKAAPVSSRPAPLFYPAPSQNEKRLAAPAAVRTRPWEDRGGDPRDGM